MRPLVECTDCEAVFVAEAGNEPEPSHGPRCPICEGTDFSSLE